MLQSVNQLTGATVHALDGDVGSITDFYFDDENWVIRYAIVKTGSWLTGRRVVIPVISLLSPDWEHKRLPAQLAREQIRTSPDVLTHPEVSRALESELLSYYGFPFYWAGDALWGPVSNPALAAEHGGILPSPNAPLEQRAETHLRSCRDLIGYAVHARDGEVGHLNDLMLDTTAWAIDALSVDPGSQRAEPLTVSPRSVTRLDWAARTLRIDLSRRALLTSEEEVRRANGALTHER